MITERGEAFKHNSCKKLAQLAKVIFQMKKAKLERDEEITSIVIKYESTIAKIVEEHQNSVENIAKKLVAFRKSCIDQECQDYASQYRVIKSRLTNLSKEKLQILQNIVKEGEEAVQNINNIQKTSLNETNKFLEYANQTQDKIKNLLKNSQTTIDKKAKKSIQPILDKIAKLQKENEAKMKQILTQHAQDIRSNRTEIYSILKEAILQRKDEFNSYRSSLSTLKTDINSMKKEYNQVKKEKEAMNSDIKSKQKSIISTTVKNFNETATKIDNLINNEKKSESEREFQITELNKVKQNLINSHQKDLNNLIAQIQCQKQQIEQFETAKTAKLEKQQTAFESLTSSLQKEFETNIKNRSETFSELTKSFGQSTKDLSLIKGHLQSIIDESTAKTNNRRDLFKLQLSKENQSISNSYEKQLNNFKDAAKNRVTILTNSLKSQDNLNHEIQKQIRKEIQQLLDQLKKLQSQILTEIEEKKKKEENDKIEYKKSTDLREQNRKSEIELIMNRRKSEKEKQFSSSKEKLNIELIEKKKKLSVENQSRIDEYKKNTENLLLNFEKEENEHKSKLLKMKGKLKFATDQYESAKRNSEQRLSVLQNEIQNLEKLIRQIQRKIKTETQSINEEYEMKIQIEQVKLNNAIENISKLYDKDENLRGVEIVEAIRKLRDIKNRTADLQLKKKHEIENEEKEFQKKKSEIECDIENFKTHRKLNELNEHLNKLTTDSIKELNEIETEKNSKMSSLIKQSNQIKNEQEIKIKEIKDQIEIENRAFQSKVDQIKSNENELNSKTEQQLKDIQNQFELNQEKLIEKHKENISKLKSRIESAKKVQIEALNNANKEYEDASKNEADLISNQCKETEESLSLISQNFIQKDSELSSQIKSLLVKVSNLHINQIMSPIRQNEEIKLANSKDELSSKDAEIQAIFNDSYKVIESAKSNIQSKSQQQQQMKFKVGSGRKAKNDLPKILETPKKHLPSILTPQLV